ncbi:nucleotide disphospho-sugar-binding domain-containing protein [Kineococcus sp. NPDC059986]|uniref:nucleotide disphospho-sugar-binding domain-containing protein n=1 Tax=Kineococcus sp. NPDC059986 TaxID=3155538 RepID=UPI00344C151C
MRVLVVTAVVASHFGPCAPLAWALRSAGHDVVVAADPATAAAVAGAGLPTRAAGTDARFAARYRDQCGGDPKALFCAVAAAMCEEVLPWARWWRPDVVVHDPTAFAGPVVAAATGALAVRASWGPDLVLRGRGPAGYPDALEDLAGRHGVSVRQSPPGPDLDPTPALAQLPDLPGRVAVRPLPWTGATRIPVGGSAVLAAPGPARRVVVCLGRSRDDLGSDGDVERVLAGVDALVGDGVEVVVAATGGQAAAVRRSAPHARTLVEAPLDRLLPGAALLVHHGGAGSASAGAVAGVPQLAVPDAPENRFSAGRYALTGATRVLPEGADVTAACRALLDDAGARAAADRVRAELLAAPPPARVAHDLVHHHLPGAVR